MNQPNETLALAELARQHSDLFQMGTVAADSDTGLIQVLMDIRDDEPMSIDDITVLSRHEVKQGEPVFLILPEGKPEQAVAIPLLPDPKIDRLAAKLDQLLL